MTRCQLGEGRHALTLQRLPAIVKPASTPIAAEECVSSMSWSRNAEF
jgi:hypothetical protein